MKRWRRIVLIAGLLLALTVGGLYEASTHVVRGWLRGEAFYDGRPTSYWRAILVSDLDQNPDEMFFEEIGRSGMYHSFRRWIGIDRPYDSSWSLLKGGRATSRANIESERRVLNALCRDHDNRISGFARDVRAIHDRDIIFGEDTWRMLLRKHKIHAKAQSRQEACSRLCGFA